MPTVAELGYPDFEATAWFVLAAPTGTPAEVVRKINEAANADLHTGKGRQQLRTLDLQAAGGTADDARNFVKSEVAKWAPVIKAAKISM